VLICGNDVGVVPRNDDVCVALRSVYIWVHDDILGGIQFYIPPGFVLAEGVARCYRCPYDVDPGDLPCGLLRLPGGHVRPRAGRDDLPHGLTGHPDVWHLEHLPCGLSRLPCDHERPLCGL